MKKVTGCLSIIGIIFIILVAVNLFTGNTDKQSNKVNGQQYDISATSEDIAKAFTENEVGAKEKYGDKRTAITGEVVKVGSSDLEDKDFVLLKGYKGLDIHCYFERNSNSGIGKLKAGDTVTIIGKAYDKFISVLVEDCTLK